MVVRAADCLYGARWHDVRIDRPLPHRCINCNAIFVRAKKTFQRSMGGGNIISKYTTIENLKMRPDLVEQRLRETATRLKAYRRQEKMAELVKKRVEKRGVNVIGDKARGLEIAFETVNSHIEEQVKSGKLEPSDPKVLLMKANFNNLQQTASRGFKRSRTSRFDPILASYAVQQCIKMGRKTYEPLAEIFGWPCLRRVSQLRCSAIFYSISLTQFLSYFRYNSLKKAGGEKPYVP
jgi:predicted  nucleic acid-binding Zn-ribbon protein